MLAKIDMLMGAEPGTPEGDRFNVLVTLVEAYEAKHWQISPPDPSTAIEPRMRQKGLTRLGTWRRFSAVGVASQKS